jgi:hypothetical protein
VDAVYVYKSWRHELSIEPDSRVQIPTKAGFANRGMTMLKIDHSRRETFERVHAQSEFETIDMELLK